MSDNSSTGTAISSNTGGTPKSLELFSLGPLSLLLLLLLLLFRPLLPLLPLLPYVLLLRSVLFRLIFGFLSCESTPIVLGVVLGLIRPIFGADLPSDLSSSS